MTGRHFIVWQKAWRQLEVTCKWNEARPIWPKTTVSFTRHCGQSARHGGKLPRCRRQIRGLHHVIKVTSSVFNPRCRRRERFLVWTSEWRCCAGWMECICRLYTAHVVELPAGVTTRKPKQTELPSWPSGIREAGLISIIREALKVDLRWILCSRFVQYTSTAIWRINFTFSNYSIHNFDNAWHCIQHEYRWWWCSRAKGITFDATDPSTRPSHERPAVM